jgi:DNA-binding phage protein
MAADAVKNRLFRLFGYKSQFAKKMKTSRTAVDRLLDPKKSCSLKSLVMATSALGKTLQIRVV